MNGNHDLDRLFAAARETEPYLHDDGFTAGVMARLPAVRLLPFWKDSLITLVFTLVGCVAALYFFPVARLVQLLPSSFVISPLSIAAMAALAGLVAGSAYLATESSRL